MGYALDGSLGSPVVSVFVVCRGNLELRKGLGAVFGRKLCEVWGHQMRYGLGCAAVFWL